MPEAAKTYRTVRLPYDFGDVVYHRAKRDKVAGIVTGFNVFPGNLMIGVTWGDDLREMHHYFVELSSEFEPTIE